MRTWNKLFIISLVSIVLLGGCNSFNESVQHQQEKQSTNNRQLVQKGLPPKVSVENENIKNKDLSKTQEKNAIFINVNNKKSPLYTYKGEVFVAVPISKNVQGKIQQVQKQILKCIGVQNFSPAPLSNLHITLQLIGPVASAAEVTKIHGALTQAAVKNKPLDLAKHLGHTRLSIHNDGIVTLQLSRSDGLTKLARTVRASLKNKGIKFSPRFDFPDRSHITIGIMNTGNIDNFKKIINQCVKKKQITIAATLQTRAFPVDYFVLLKSNRPAKQRHYAQLGIYSL